MKKQDYDFSLEDLGTYELPPEIAHLEEFKKFAKPVKEDVWGFAIPQWDENDAPNPLWYSIRENFIGASQIATILGQDEYGDKVKLFYSKLGDSFPFVSSKFTQCGLFFEERISDLWEYEDGTEEGWIHNSFKGEKIRNKVPVPFYCINLNYPHISFSLDYLVEAHQPNPFTGEILDYSYPLEIKNLSQMSSDKYKSGIPQKYVLQCITQQFGWGVDYSEISALVAGNTLITLPLDLDIDICSNIIEQTYEFWQRVKLGKELYKDYHTKTPEEQKQVDMELMRIEPEPSGNADSFKEFMHAKYLVSYADTARLGTEEEWDLAVKAKKLNDQIKVLKKEKDVTDQMIKLSVRHDEVVDFGKDRGRILYKRTALGKTVYRNNVKGYEDD